jgi:hypothetical protein
MLSRHDEVIRVGVRVVVVAAIVGLVVLLFSGSASSQEFSPSEEAAQLLISSQRPSAAERVEEAESLLREEKRRRISAVQVAILGTAWQAFSQASPRRLLKSAGRLLREIRELGGRSAAEDRALDLLEAEVLAGSEDPRLRELYEALRQREEKDRFGRWLEEAEQAIVHGDLRLARRRLDRARESQLESARVEPLWQALAEREKASEAAPETPLALEIEAFEAWEASFGAALLTGRYGAALELSATRPDAELAQAVARYLSGETDEALEAMRSLSELEGPAGSLARRWLEDVALGPQRGSTVEQGRDRVKRLLGSAEVGEQGTRPYRSDAGVWQKSARRLEMALSLPGRISRGSRAAGSELRNAALRTLKLDSSSAPGQRPPAEWEDGFLVLPRARTSYAPVRPRPLLVSRTALEAVLGESAMALAPGLADAEAILFEPLRAAKAVEGPALPAENALLVVSALAGGIEGGKLRSYAQDRGVVLESIRRLDAAVRAGAGLSAQPWSSPADSLGTALRRSLLKGDTAKLGAVSLSRRKRSLKAAGNWIGHELPCPARTVCVDRTRALRAGFYGHLDLSADARVGARTSFHDAKLAVELSRSGPHASLVLPVAAWLGLSRWVPLEAFLELGLGGISGGPRFARPKEERHASSMVPLL